MIAHVILFGPRADLSEGHQRELLDALTAAAAQIPSVRRFRVGRRAMHGLPGYEQAMPTAYTFAAIVEFDDLDGLTAYLTHPAHRAIGEHFTMSALNALAYDYQMVEASEAAQLIR